MATTAPTVASVCAAAKHASRALARLPRAEKDAALEAMAAALGDPQAFQHENRRFHDLLAFCSGNPVARFLLPALHWISDGAGLEYSPEERARVLRAMRGLLAAIEARDKPRACDIMQRFFAASLEYLERTYPEIMARPIEWTGLDL